MAKKKSTPEASPLQLKAPAKCRKAVAELAISLMLILLTPGGMMNAAIGKITPQTFAPEPNLSLKLA